MDLIDRQTAIDTFLTELTKRERKNLLHTWSTVEVKYFVADMLEKLPSVQPDIIRCKDCKHKGTKNCVANAWTTILGVTVKDDFYCGLAEKENR